MSAMDAATLPAALAETREDFLALGVKDRLTLLLDFSNELPELPDRYRDHPDLLERVHMHATAPAEAPTTRGFASILAQGLDGLTPEQVLAIPADYPQTLGLGEAVSPLRVRGMSGMLARAKRQLQERLAG
jgi:cysteine desulfuration protein SufE